MEKVTSEEYEAPTFGLFGAEVVPIESQHEDEYVPAHKNFRDKYFRGFKKEGETAVNGEPGPLNGEGLPRPG
jgi:hypothetical protein